MRNSSSNNDNENGFLIDSSNDGGLTLSDAQYFTQPVQVIYEEDGRDDGHNAAAADGGGEEDDDCHVSAISSRDETIYALSSGAGRAGVAVIRSRAHSLYLPFRL